MQHYFSIIITFLENGHFKSIKLAVLLAIVLNCVAHIQHEFFLRPSISPEAVDGCRSSASPYFYQIA